ncbi:MAG: ribonuclease PH [Pelagibacteraceae bacterium]|nr:ribonuclease PH [Pelagibacteraceae bacterium]|tara:strand:+ start:7500 stop:8228 length:729 start_codon:yes stop_codon:yes gene_type:complete
MSGYSRSDRSLDDIRGLDIITNIQPNNKSSCLVKLGNTHVLCSAVIEDKVPSFLRNSGKGWLTAEYGMLPSSTDQRVDREAARGKQSGRTQEIQRLIGRSLRCAVNLNLLGEKTIKVDCDVISADGGTRTASIIGGYVSLARSINVYKKNYNLNSQIIVNQIAAISVGVVNGTPCVDLNYPEDSNAEVDCNVVMSGDGNFIEFQSTGEEAKFSKQTILDFIQLVEKVMPEINKIQNKAISIA